MLLKKKTEQVKDWGVQGGVDRQSAVLNKVVRISLLEKVRYDQRLGEGGRVSCTDIWGKDMWMGGGSSLHEGL